MESKFFVSHSISLLHLWRCSITERLIMKIGELQSSLLSTHYYVHGDLRDFAELSNHITLHQSEIFSFTQVSFIHLEFIQSVIHSLVQ